MTIRQNVAAVIVRDAHVLLAAYDDASGRHYNYPGGGIEDGESCHEALRREVYEETGATVTVIGRLLLAWEYAPQQHAHTYGEVHKLCLMFECAIADFDEPLAPAQADANQIGAHWLPLDQLAASLVLPDVTAPLLAALRTDASGAPFITDF